MAEDKIVKIVSEQRRRLIASLLNHCEQTSWWRTLSAADQKALRDKVITSVGTFYDLVRDVIKVADEGVLRNEHALDLLAQIHDSQCRLESTLTP